ncbi:MAG: hypothetical protein PHT02_04505 [Tissierellia bacterium]|nr:hypothetical protein [Tissierellia bacterium]
MSRINAIRIINLNYNNNTIKIDDETFDFASESTLMSLRNGGGKTVLVQMMMAPFVSKRNRDLKDRKFNSYFNTNPTYLLTEWQLDDGGGFLLVGMVIRKKLSSSDEDSTDELDIYTFIHHYSKKSKYDIYNIPIIETKKDRKKSIKGYQTFKTELEDARKSLKDPLDIYNMSIYEQSKKYFQRLKEYKINNKEWDIIHKINLKESGLSELFSDAKNEEGLVEKWFLSTVEEKLNKNGNKIVNFRDIVKKYIFAYREIQSKIEKKDTIELFCENLNSLIEESTNLNKSEIKLEKQKNLIANFINYLSNLNIKIETEINELNNKIDELKTKVNNLKYQEISKEWYEKDDELDKANNLINELFEEQCKLESKKINIERLLHIYECAEINDDYKDKLKKLRELESILDNINKTELEKAPLRNDLGYSLKIYYEKKFNFLNEQLKNINEKLKSLNHEKVYCKSLNDKLIKEQNKSIEKRTELATLIKSFENEEEDFERRTKILLSKNLLGMYEDGFLETIENNINNIIIKVKSKKIDLEKENEVKTDLIESKNNEQQELISTQGQLNNLLDNLVKEKIKYDEEIDLRRNVIRILNMSEEDVYKKDLIISNLHNKIDSLINKGDDLVIEKSIVENEKTKLERGIFTEVPFKLKEKLDELDIEFLYGMDWINKNKRSRKENEELIKNNPILPYSLIISEDDINIIQKSNIDEFVSNPIPIIKRSSIDKEIQSINNLLKFNDILFYISFDKRLVNKEDLNNILNERAAEITKINEKIALNAENRKDYEEKLYKIRGTVVEEKLYKEISKKIEDTRKDINELNEKIIKNKSIIKHAKIIISKNSENVNLYFEELSKLNKSMEYFIDLKNNYNKYLTNRELLNSEEKRYKEIVERIIENNGKLEKLTLDLDEEKEHLIQSKNNIINVEKELINYNQFKEGNIINRDYEVIKSEFDSLTSKITNDRVFAEKMKNEADIEFKEIQNKLLEKIEEYQLEESDFNGINYDSFKHKEIKNKYKYTNELLNKQNKEIHEEEIKRKEIEVNKKNIINKIKEKFNVDYPKEKDLIMDINFNNEIKLNVQEKEQLEKIFKSKEYERSLVNRNIDRLDQFRDFYLTKELSINVTIDSIETYKNEIVKTLNSFEAEVHKNRTNMIDVFDKIYTNIKFKSESMCNSSLETIRDCMNYTNSLLEQLNIVLLSCQTLIEKLQVDIDFIYKDEEEVITILFDYIKDVHDNLGMIDDNSSVNIEGKSIKMLKIKLPDWDLNKERYKNNLKFIIDKLRDESLRKLSENEAVEEIISKNISINYLYNNVVGISNIEIKLYKIEETRQSEISWNNVSTNSGGEGFLSAFVILSSLLTYMRKDETDIFSNNKDSKVLVMDNPFAQTNAVHLLKPLMSIADKSNTQLICFSGLGGDSIYNRFDNIYVLDTVQSRLKPNQQYLRQTHEKGENYVSNLHSSRFKIEELSVDQITLF